MMKNLCRVFLFVAMAAMVSACSSSASIQEKNLNKALANEYKTKMKEFNKEGWKIFATSRSIEVALQLHYKKINDGEGKVSEVVGLASAFKSKNIGHQIAVNNACNLYARQAGSYVKGRIVSDMASNANDLSGEFDHFYAAYESAVEKEIKGELIESFSLIRQTGKEQGVPVYEMQSFFTVNEDAALQARIRAFENAAKESAAAQKYASKVSQFIKEGFPVEGE